MKIHYLLLGFVLMISGLEVTAQEGVTHVCGGIYRFESAHPEDYALVTDSETIYPNADAYITSNLGYITVWVGLQYHYVESSGTECEITEATAQAEHDMLVWVHEAKQRGVFDGVFGRGGE